MRSTGLAALALLATSATASAGTIHVRGRTSIADALAAAKPGDRIVVHGGRHVGVVLDRDDVTVVGVRGATLVGRATISGSRVRLQGFRVVPNRDLRDQGVEVSGDDVSSVRNRFRSATFRTDENADRFLVERNSAFDGFFGGPGADAVVRNNKLGGCTDVEVGDRGLVEDNTGGHPNVVFEADDVVVRGNRIDVLVGVGDRAVVEYNAMAREAYVIGDEAQVRGNVFASEGVKVEGDAARVVGNVVRHTYAGVQVTGRAPVVTDNRISTGVGVPKDAVALLSDRPGIRIESPDGDVVVARNRVNHVGGAGIVLIAGGATVEENVLVGDGALSSIVVLGSANAVSGNEVAQDGEGAPDAVGIELTGDANVVSGNAVSSSAAEGIAVRGGSDNVIADNVLRRTGGVGILVGPDARGTEVSNCDVFDCAIGIVNGGQDTSLAESRVEGNRRIDVLDLAGLELLSGNTLGLVSGDRGYLPATTGF